MVLRPEKEAEARAVFDKWDLDFAVVGETIPEDRFIVRLGGEVKADLPLKALSGAAPEYDRPWVADPAAGAARAGARRSIRPRRCCALIGSPNLCGRAWVWSQYDHQVMARHRACRRARTPAWCGCTAPARRSPSPRTSTRATAAPTRSAAACRRWPRPTATSRATGARPLAATDNLNFGNPERPEIMGQLVGCIRGIAAACAALDMPIVSGNVSLYNETEGRAILPTPTIGGVGLLDALERADPHGAARRRPAAAARRDARPSRAVGAARRALRPRGRRRAAGRPRRRAGGGRVPARGERGGAGRARRTTSPTAAWRWRRRRWRWRAASGVELVADDRARRRRLVLRRGPGPLPVACRAEAVGRAAGAGARGRGAAPRRRAGSAATAIRLGDGARRRSTRARGGARRRALARLLD